MNHMLLLRKKRQRKGSNYEELKHVFLQTSLQLNTTYLSLHKLKLRVPTLPQKWPWQGVSTDRTQLAKEDKQRNKTACCWCHWQTKILLLNCYVLNRWVFAIWKWRTHAFTWLLSLYRKRLQWLRAAGPKELLRQLINMTALSQNTELRKTSKFCYNGL